MASVDGRRVAEVVADFGDGRRLRGSGVLLRADVFVTAWHVVAGAGHVRVVFEAGSGGVRTATARTRLRLGSSDVAVVLLDGLADIVSDVVRVGGFGARPAVIAAEAFGFPRFKVRNTDGSHPTPGDGKRKFRELAQMSAELAPQGNWRTGRCELIVTAPEPDADPRVSAWEGMSGAPVFDQQSGLLVAVVTDHHRPEGLSRLAAVRLDLAVAELSGSDRARMLPLLGLEPEVRLPQAGVAPWVGWKRQAIADQLAEIVPVDGLRERDAELAALTAFCAGPESYGYWQAPAWAGKTALMATFALHPPAGVTVVPYFVTARQAGENDSTGFLRAVSGQLAALMGEDLPNLITTREVYRTFLAERARQAHGAGQLLVLLVDGLDEDTGTHAGSGVPSIASLLPRKPVAGLKVIVSGRPHPRLPDDLPADHPARLCRPRLLSASPYATEIERSAQLELKELLAAGGLRRDVVGLITASGGGLTLADLEELTGQPRYMVADLLGSVFGRTIRGRLVPTAADPQHVYLFAHDKLREQALSILDGQELNRHRQRIHNWADCHRDQRWPSGTPRYLLTGYQRMLNAAGDLARLADLAEDTARHDRMYDHTGGDDTAYAEIDDALRQLAAADNPDLRTMVRIARHLDGLRRRNRNIPPELPAVWAMLGNIPRAEALVHSIADPETRTQALAGLVAVVAGVDVERAERISKNVADPDARTCAIVVLAAAVAGVDAQRAEQIALAITDYGAKAQALAGLAVAVASVDAERAEQIALAITDYGAQAQALAGLTEVVAQVDADRARRIAKQAEQITSKIFWQSQVDRLALLTAEELDNTRAASRSEQATTIASSVAFSSFHAGALAQLAAAVEAADAERAEQLARSIIRLGGLPQAPSDLAAAVAAADMASDRDEQFLRRLIDPGAHAQALTGLVRAAATVDARRIEQAVHGLPDPVVRARALAGVAAANVDSAAADRISNRAEQIVRGIDHPVIRARALTALAAAEAGVRAERARHLVVEAEQIARGIAYSHFDAEVLVGLARSIASADTEWAEQIAHAVTDSVVHAEVLAGLAEAVASTDAERAERIAFSIADPQRRAWALAGLVSSVAGADVERAEQIASAITHPGAQAQALAGLAEVVARMDVKRAERIASSIADPDLHEQALAGLVRSVASADVEQAEQIARSITNPRTRAFALADLVAQADGIDTERSERIAYSITDMVVRNLVLPSLVRAIAKRDIERADQIARAIPDPQVQARALSALAVTVACTNVERAEQIIHSITHPGVRPGFQAHALAEVAETVARTNVRRAEQIASTITDSVARAQALTGIVKSLARVDVERAEQIARTITAPSAQAEALIRIALVDSPAALKSMRKHRLLGEALRLGGSWSAGLTALPIEVQKAICDDLLHATTTSD